MKHITLLLIVVSAVVALGAGPLGSVAPALNEIEYEIGASASENHSIMISPAMVLSTSVYEPRPGRDGKPRDMWGSRAVFEPGYGPTLRSERKVKRNYRHSHPDVGATARRLSKIHQVERPMPALRLRCFAAT